MCAEVSHSLCKRDMCPSRKATPCPPHDAVGEQSKVGPGTILVGGPPLCWLQQRKKGGSERRHGTLLLHTCWEGKEKLPQALAPSGYKSISMYRIIYTNIKERNNKQLLENIVVLQLGKVTFPKVWKELVLELWCLITCLVALEIFCSPELHNIVKVLKKKNDC